MYIQQVADHDGNLLLFGVNSEDINGHYQCVDNVSNITLLSYHVTVNSVSGSGHYLSEYA